MINNNNSKQYQPAMMRNKTMRVGIVAATFYEDMAEEMIELAKKTAAESGAQISRVIKVPGSFDIPLAVKKLLEDKEVDGVVTLGAIIKGETDHDQVIAIATVKTLQELSLQFNKPVTLGINGPGMSLAQAQARIDRAASATSACIRLLGELDG